MSGSKVSCRSRWSDVCLAQKWASAFRREATGGGGVLSTSRYNYHGENAVQPTFIHSLSVFIGRLAYFSCFVDTNVEVISLFVWRISFGRMLWPVTDQQSRGSRHGENGGSRLLQNVGIYPYYLPWSYSCVLLLGAFAEVAKSDY
jgi:hypothetical protein